MAKQLSNKDNNSWDIVATGSTQSGASISPPHVGRLQNDFDVSEMLNTIAKLYPRFKRPKRAQAIDEALAMKTIGDILKSKDIDSDKIGKATAVIVEKLLGNEVRDYRNMYINKITQILDRELLPGMRASLLGSSKITFRAIRVLCRLNIENLEAILWWKTINVCVFKKISSNDKKMIWRMIQCMSENEKTELNKNIEKLQKIIERCYGLLKYYGYQNENTSNINNEENKNENSSNINNEESKNENSSNINNEESKNDNTPPILNTNDLLNVGETAATSNDNIPLNNNDNQIALSVEEAKGEEKVIELKEEKEIELKEEKKNDTDSSDVNIFGIPLRTNNDLSGIISEYHNKIKESIIKTINVVCRSVPENKRQEISKKVIWIVCSFEPTILNRLMVEPINLVTMIGDLIRLFSRNGKGETVLSWKILKWCELYGFSAHQQILKYWWERNSNVWEQCLKDHELLLVKLLETLQTYVPKYGPLQQGGTQVFIQNGQLVRGNIGQTGVIDNNNVIESINSVPQIDSNSQRNSNMSNSNDPALPSIPESKEDSWIFKVSNFRQEQV